MVTRRQHYVWRHYLETWQGKDGLVSCLRDQKIFRPNPINIMLERDFYKLQKLTRADLSILQKLLIETTGSPYLRELHKTLIEQFAHIAEANERLKVHPNASGTDREMVRKLTIEAEEKLHCGVEESAKPILEALRNKDGNVIYSDDTAIPFFDFISHQFFRTKRKRDAIVGAVKEILPAENAQRIRNLLCYCYATNTGGSLYVERHGWEIIFLDCPAGSEFITGDQPVVNILTNRDGRPPEELAFYYPLSPNLAMILAPTSLESRAILTKFDISATNEINDLIAWESGQFLIARSPDQLTRHKLKSHTQPPVPLSFLPDIR